MRYPMEVNLIGDSAATLRKLLPLLDRKPDRSWRETIEKNVKSWWEVLQNRAMNDANPLNPQRVFWELSPKLPEECHHCLRHRLGHQLVCARRQNPWRT